MEEGLIRGELASVVGEESGRKSMKDRSIQEGREEKEEAISLVKISKGRGEFLPSRKERSRQRAPPSVP